MRDLETYRVPVMRVARNRHRGSPAMIGMRVLRGRGRRSADAAPLTRVRCFFCAFKRSNPTVDARWCAWACALETYRSASSASAKYAPVFVAGICR